MARQKRPPTAIPSDDAVRALLERHRCPVPFHAVRTRFLGNIASPSLAASPLQDVKQLWGGELPVFDGEDELNEFMTVLVMGLWNGLTRHQERGHPFRLARFDTDATAAGLARLALVRREELDGFVYGLFGPHRELDLPERARRALDELARIRALADGAHGLATEPVGADPGADIAAVIAQFRELTRIAEHEMHETVLACTRARRQALASAMVARPTLH